MAFRPRLSRVSSAARLQARLQASFVKQLAGALARLSPPWQVLRNGRPDAADGPPWVGFILLHPRLGIALLDPAPARPTAAIAPLRELLQRGDFERRFPGHLPIIADDVTKQELAGLPERLVAAFAQETPCTIADEGWC